MEQAISSVSSASSAALWQVSVPVELLFVSPTDQLSIVRALNDERGWQFTASDFQELGNPPAWPSQWLCAVVLDVSLDTVMQTVEEAWQVITEIYPRCWRWKNMRSDPKHLRLLPGISHHRGLQWRVVNNAANWDTLHGINPADVRNPRSSPHSAILWEAVFFSRLTQAMDGVTIPHLWIPGYQVTVPGAEQPWLWMPAIRWFGDNRELGFDAGTLDPDDLRSVPAFVDA